MVLLPRGCELVKMIGCDREHVPRLVVQCVDEKTSAIEAELAH